MSDLPSSDNKSSDHGPVNGHDSQPKSNDNALLGNAVGSLSNPRNETKNAAPLRISHLVATSGWPTCWWPFQIHNSNQAQGIPASQPLPASTKKKSGDAIAPAKISALTNSSSKMKTPSKNPHYSMEDLLVLVEVVGSVKPENTKDGWQRVADEYNGRTTFMMDNANVRTPTALQKKYDALLKLDITSPDPSMAPILSQLRKNVSLEVEENAVMTTVPSHPGSIVDLTTGKENNIEEEKDTTKVEGQTKHAAKLQRKRRLKNKERLEALKKRKLRQQKQQEAVSESLSKVATAIEGMQGTGLNEQVAKLEGEIRSVQDTLEKVLEKLEKK